MDETERADAERKVVLDILLKDYDQRRNEIVSIFQRYDKHAQTLTVYLTIVATLATVLLAVSLPGSSLSVGGISLKLPANISQHSDTFSIAAVTVGVFIAFYFIANLMELLQLLQVHSARTAAIEARIAELTGKRLLIWDSKIIPEVYSFKNSIVGPFVCPQLLTGLWAASVFVAIIALFSFICYALTPNAFPYWATIIWLLTLYHIIVWGWITAGRRTQLFKWVRAVTSAESTDENTPPPPLNPPSEFKKQISRLVTKPGGLIVVVLTLLCGFIPFVVFSLLTDSFWPHSRVSVPLTIVPSVLIGDSLLIPLFNRSLYQLMSTGFREVSRITRVRLILFGIGCILITAPVIIYEHILWTQDQYTGFIDLLPGQLSPAGIWHTCFAVLETGIAVWFLGVSLWWAKDRRRLPRPLLLRTWRLFLMYASLCIFDLAINRVFIAPGGAFPFANVIALLPIALALAVYILVARLSREQTPAFEQNHQFRPNGTGVADSASGTPSV